MTLTTSTYYLLYYFILDVGLLRFADIVFVQSVIPLHKVIFVLSVIAYNAFSPIIDINVVNRHNILIDF